MFSFRQTLMTGAVIPAVVGAGISLGGFAVFAGSTETGAEHASSKSLPTAKKRPASGQLASCNPCAAKKGCNPCAAKKGCNPCAAKKGCNPCAAKKGCGASNPCNPCAGGGTKWSSECVVPRLQQAAACNPCAAKKGCNPCAAKKGCNPCAAKKGCNPCAAKKGCGACNPCNPCAAGPTAELNAAEAHKAYECLLEEMKAAYAKAGIKTFEGYTGWNRANTRPYTSATHGNRFVNNYANAKAKSYDQFEKAGKMPIGAVVAKDSFVAAPDGKTGPGPIFVMEKMKAGWNAESGDWQYTMVMPDGSLFGRTKGENSAGMKFCAECHMSVAEQQDSLFFLPDEFRVKK